jgi:Domain of unknown function (DUF5666)
MLRRRTTCMLLGALTALVAAGAALAASPVAGTISGPITSVKGSTFTVSTKLVSSGSAKVTVGSKTTITEEEPGSTSDLKTGVCVMASGTKKGKTVTATRISIADCTRPGGTRRPGQTAGRGGNTGRGNFKPPASLGFAFGTISKVKGSTLTVKGQQGSTTVELDSKTQITKTAKVGASALAVKLCAFVRGTSSNGGITVEAQQVQLTKPVGGSCNAFPRRP